MKVLFSFVFSIYRNMISPAIQLLFDIRCRYQETCSRYMERMISEKGFLKGFVEGFRRFLTCNKWSSHG